MINEYSIINEVLSGEKKIEDGIIEINKILKEIDENEYTRVSTAYRVLKAYMNIGQGGSWEDFASNLRQLDLYYDEPIYISEEIKENINRIKNKVNIGSYEHEGKNMIIVDKTMPGWFQDKGKLDEIYNLKTVRDKNKKVLGDPFLYKMTGFKTYRSATQKALIEASINMAGGSTLLGCMSTGEGKSLISLLPQYYKKEGLTIVVVPTVSLAIDQQRSSLKYYENKNDKPVAYYSGLESKFRIDILKKIEKGKIPLLYISPEALMNDVFKDSILYASKKGLVNRLIIDEAHIVEDWGNQFRTEFQLLSVFRRKLLESTSGKLKTILLSATFTEEGIELLKNLFSDDDNFIEIRGDSLRSEIQYYYAEAKSKNDKLKKLEEIIYLLPRPIIIYTIRPDEAKRLKDILNEWNIRNTRLFTGQITDREEREDIINEWVNNDVDIIIATSAFGMGVDKKDVRSVVHYSIPESINRYYQEVGRGGRDGIGSISLLISDVNEDLKESRSLTRTRSITIDKFLDRWNAMKGSHIDGEELGTFWIDLDAKPIYMDWDYIAGGQSRAWNENVLLILYKDNLIDILDIKYGKERKALIRVADTWVINHPDKLLAHLEESRDKERQLNDLEIEEVDNFIRKGIKNKCMGRILSEIYVKSSSSCNTCTYCRMSDRQSYREEPREKLIIRGKTKLQQDKLEHATISGLEDNGQISYLYSDKSNLVEIVNKIVKDKVHHIVLKEDDIYGVEDFATTDDFFTISTFKEVNEMIENEVSGNILLLYSNDDYLYNEKLMVFAEKMKEAGNRIIHLSSTISKGNRDESIQNRLGLPYKFIN